MEVRRWVSLNQSLPYCQSFFFLFLSISLSFPLSLLLLSFSVFLSLKKVDVSIENSRFCTSISLFQVVWQFALNTSWTFYNSQVTSIFNVVVFVRLAVSKEHRGAVKDEYALWQRANEGYTLPEPFIRNRPTTYQIFVPRELRSIDMMFLCICVVWLVYVWHRKKKTFSSAIDH